MRVLINIKGTAAVSVCLLALHSTPPRDVGDGDHGGVYVHLMRVRIPHHGGVYVHLMRVRTEETRLINRAFILASSPGRPKPGSADAVQPTVIWVSRVFRCTFASLGVCIDARGPKGVREAW